MAGGAGGGGVGGSDGGGGGSSGSGVGGRLLLPGVSPLIINSRVCFQIAFTSCRGAFLLLLRYLLRL